MSSFYRAVGVDLEIASLNNISDEFRQVDVGPENPLQRESSLHRMFSLNGYDDGIALFFVERIGMGQQGASWVDSRAERPARSIHRTQCEVGLRLPPCCHQHPVSWDMSWPMKRVTTSVCFIPKSSSPASQTRSTTQAWLSRGRQSHVSHGNERTGEVNGWTGMGHLSQSGYRGALRR